jgi:Transient receptor potential (TRP) ion channel
LWVALMLSIVELSLFSTNNLINRSFATLPQMLSTIASVLVFIFLLGFPVFIFKLTNRHYTQLWNPEFYHRYAFFYCEFKLSTRAKKTFMSVIVSRLTLYGIIIAGLQNSPLAQTLCVAILQGLYLLCLIKIDPFISKIIKILNYIMEGFLSVIFILYCILGYDKANGSKLPVGPKD